MKDVVSVEAASVCAVTGIEGDHTKKGKRQVTILSSEAWKEVCSELGTELCPSTRRANLLVEGIDLSNPTDSLGGLVVVGEVVIRIAGETQPCRLMDDAMEGLKDTLTPNWRGGVFGEALNNGEIAVGDDVIFCSSTAVPDIPPSKDNV